MKKKCGKIKKHFISIPVVKFLINSVYFWYIWRKLFGYWKETWYEKPRAQGKIKEIQGETWTYLKKHQVQESGKYNNGKFEGNNGETTIFPYIIAF